MISVKPLKRERMTRRRPEIRQEKRNNESKKTLMQILEAVKK